MDVQSTKQSSQLITFQQGFLPAIAQAMAGPEFYNAPQRALERWFAAVDTERTGRISTAEMQKALVEGGLYYSLKLVGSLVRMHDSTGRGMDFGQFSECQQYLKMLQAVYAKHDPASTGLINLQAVQMGLGELGFTLDMAAGGAFYKLCESFDFGRNGLIGQDAFVAMAVQLSNSKRIFDLFDAEQTGTVALDFNQITWLISQT